MAAPRPEPLYLWLPAPDPAEVGLFKEFKESALSGNVVDLVASPILKQRRRVVH